MTTRLAKAWEITEKMLDVRKAAAGIGGVRYQTTVAVWRDRLREAAERLGCQVILVVPRLEEVLRKRGDELSGVELMWLIAATVEEIEAEASG